MRIHLTPALGTERSTWEFDWLVRCAERERNPRHTLVDHPRDADAILITDAWDLVTHFVRVGSALRLLAHPLLYRYPSRCFLYFEQDVPRPYLPGVYTNLEWSPATERDAEAIVRQRMYAEWPNPHLTDAPPPRERDLLFSFRGRDSHPLRARLFATRFDRPDVEIVDTTATYHHYDGRGSEEGQRAFVEQMRRSRWALCPRGWSAASPRVFEAMRLGIAPVVLCDRWLRPYGPDWARCSLWIPERELPRLPEILEAQGDAWWEMGRAAQEEWRRWFTPERTFEQIGDALERIALRRASVSVAGEWIARAGELAAHWRNRPGPRFVMGRRVPSAVERYGTGVAGAPPDAGPR